MRTSRFDPTKRCSAVESIFHDFPAIFSMRFPPGQSPAVSLKRKAVSHGGFIVAKGGIAKGFRCGGMRFCTGVLL